MRRTISLFLKHGKEIVLGVRAQGQDFEFIHKATVHGTIVDGETHKQAIARILEEESGIAFSELYELESHGHGVVGVNTPEECFYFSASITDVTYKRLLPQEDIERFASVGKADVEHNIRILSQADGLDVQKNIIMFDDEYEIIRKLLA